MKDSNYEIVESTDELVLLRDLGPWDTYSTVTNNAEQVVDELAPMLRGRRLEYLDSEGDRAELLVKDHRFAGFKPVHQPAPHESGRGLPHSKWFRQEVHTIIRKWELLMDICSNPDEVQTMQAFVEDLKELEAKI